MKTWHAILLTLLVVGTLGAHAQGKPPLRLIHTTPLPGFEGGDFDHITADVKGNRLYVAAEAHKTVEVFDLRTGERLHSIKGFVEPHGICVVPNSNKVIVSDEDQKAGVGWVKLVNKRTYQITDTITLPGGADVLLFDPATKYLYVRARSPATAKSILLAIIDTDTFKRTGDIILPGYRSEGMAIERSGKRRLFVTLTGTQEVGLVDPQAREVIARWAVPEATPQTTVQTLALDEENHRVFVATRKPGRFFAFNTDTGQVVASMPSVDRMDDMSFDAARKRIYVTGAPSTSVFRERDPDHYEHIADIPTGPDGQEGKTSIFVPELNRLYVMQSGEIKPQAKVALMIFEPVL
jgi:DNA-binding beta-propeller fold protein YncE